MIILIGQIKTIHIVSPAYDGDDDFAPEERRQMKFSSDEEIRRLEINEMGYLYKYNSKTGDYDYVYKVGDLLDNEVYVIRSSAAHHKAAERVRRHVDDNVLEREATMAVKQLLGPSAHEHCNVITTAAEKANSTVL